MITPLVRITRRLVVPVWPWPVITETEWRRASAATTERIRAGGPRRRNHRWAA